VNSEVHMVVVNDQDHPQMIDICAKLQRLSSAIMSDAGVCGLYKICSAMWKKKKMRFICTTVMRT
jgi:hypothetical protein